MTGDRLAAARAYLDRGWIIHPLSSPKDKKKSPGKRPLLKTWQLFEKVTDNDIKKWFSDTDPYFRESNIGLQCGKRSDVIVIDIDHEHFMEDLFGGFEVNTLKSRRTEGRGHMYFKYVPGLPAQKHHALGIEILSDGSNAVLPPSIHEQGDVYKWSNPDAPIIDIPAKLIENINKLFDREKRLNLLINKCRPCFKNYWKDEKKITHGSTARLFLGAFCSELYNRGADLDIIKIFAKILYKKDYDESKTEIEFRGWTQHGFKPWTCDKIKEQCVGFNNCDNCKISRVDEKENKEDENNGNGKSYNQASDLIRYTSLPGVELFHDEKKEPYARLPIDGRNMIVPIGGREFRRWLTRSFYADTGTAPGSDALTGALGVIEAVACYTGKEHELFNRVAYYDDAIWYDLGGGEAVKISPGSWEIVTDPPILFRHHTHQKAHDTGKIKQNGNVKKVLDFVNVQSESEKLLFLVYLISCFVPEIPHPIPVLYGDKGSSKTTALKMVKEIVDPSVLTIISFPHNNQELVQKLYHHYYAPFDNIADLSDSQSDALCRACTGEGVSKRALFTNEDDVIFNYRRCVALNGVNLVADKPDLLDRAILLQMERIPREKRKTENKVWKEFNEVKGDILGGIFNTLSQAATIKPNIRLEELPRMADFMEWACAISEALGAGMKAAKDAYLGNIQSQNKEAIDASPIGDVLMKFVEDGFVTKKDNVLDVEREEDHWEGTASELLALLEECATAYKINIKSKTWPKKGNSLTRKINDIKTNLADEGILFKVNKDRKCNVLSLHHIKGNTSTTSTPPQSISNEPEICGGTQKTYLHNTSTEKLCGGIDDSCGGMKTNIHPHQEQDALPSCGGNGGSGGISLYIGGRGNPSEICEFCQKPLYNGTEIEQGPAGAGQVHTACQKKRYSEKRSQGHANKAGILSEIRMEWYSTSPPGDPYNVKEMFEGEFSLRCEKAGSPITKEAAHIYVTNAFREWGWG